MLSVILLLFCLGLQQAFFCFSTLVGELLPIRHSTPPDPCNREQNSSLFFDSIKRPLVKLTSGLSPRPPAYVIRATNINILRELTQIF
jgi:hypothetical protein